jgi:hypothetical protein
VTPANIKQSALLAALLFIPLMAAAYVLAVPHGPFGGVIGLSLALLIALPTIFIFYSMLAGMLHEHLILGMALAAVAEFAWVFLTFLVTFFIRERWKSRYIK